MDLDDLMHDEKTRKKCYQLTDFVEETKVMLARASGIYHPLRRLA